MREEYGRELLRLGEKYSGLVVLDADVSSSTRSILFGEKFPDRFFNVGVSEANMVAIAGGLALCGLKPVVNTFAVFLSLKTAEQVRNVICYNRLPVILAGSYAGLSDSFDGASHQSVEDIAIMRAIPNLNVVVPADAVEMKQALEQLVALNIPAYIRICRNPSPVLFENDKPFEFGKIRTIKHGNDITIAACGITVSMAAEAAEELEACGISAELLDISTIKPLDIKTLTESVQKTKRIIAVEEHSITGGLGGAVAEALMKHCPVPMDFVGIDDRYAETGSYPELLNKFGISKDTITERAKKLIKSKWKSFFGPEKDNNR